ncbi:MAG: hypothetical protein PHC66_01185 [Candidatus Nanoarchaeia archaeon]|nr:hypothetical protein [Candidatus Nanoarchaeia archaeon]MDD5239107.1 hypothetical protein [Candidatus Nanoarchaeia archaeon]
MVNKLHLITGLIIAIIAFIGLYFYFGYAQIGAPANGALNVEINKTNVTGIKLIGAYWGTSTLPADYNDTCSNETKNIEGGFLFSVEANSGIDPVNYDECYIVNNGHKIDTGIIEMHGSYMNLEANAETDRQNMVGICCELGDRLDCSDATTLLQCPLE